jgi:transketolase
MCGLPERCTSRRTLIGYFDMKDLPEIPADPKGQATRDSSAKGMNAIAKNIPWFMGEASDLAPSTKTRRTFDGAGDCSAENYAGRNFHFGIREYAMAP